MSFPELNSFHATFSSKLMFYFKWYVLMPISSASPTSESARGIPYGTALWNFYSLISTLLLCFSPRFHELFNFSFLKIECPIKGNCIRGKAIRHSFSVLCQNSSLSLSIKRSLSPTQTQLQAQTVWFCLEGENALTLGKGGGKIS